MLLAARRLLLALAFALAALLLPASARAGDPGDGLPIVASGREADIQALAAPFALQKELSPGWIFSGISISATAIRFVLKGPGAATATLRLEHPDRAPSPERTASFALHRESSAGGPGEAPALTILDPLALAVKHNDGGHFWPAPRPVAQGQGKAGNGDAAPASLKMEEASTRWELTLRRKVLLGGLAAALLFLLADRLRPRRAAS